jgi:hypothetical protein
MILDVYQVDGLLGGVPCADPRADCGESGIRRGSSGGPKGSEGGIRRGSSGGPKGATDDPSFSAPSSGAANGDNARPCRGLSDTAPA